jgi:hypothetical protein
MRTIPVILFSAFSMLLACTNTYAQHYTIQHPILIDSLGVMKDKEGTVVAVISNDSILQDHKGEQIAFIDSTGNLISKDGIVLGNVSKNGDFRNVKNEIEYSIKPYRNTNIYYVYDATGRNVLTVSSNYTTQALGLAYVHKNMLAGK